MLIILLSYAPFPSIILPHCCLFHAKYLDLDHAGNGFNEYQYLNANTGEWVEVCDLKNDAQRCMKMDCHEPDTHFTHIGTYKLLQEEGDFFDQLFKHEGYCIWDDDQYEFMKDAKDMWPDGCTRADNVFDPEGNKVYYDMKPIAYGNLTVGLYSDASCISSLSDDESNYIWDNFMGAAGDEGDESDMYYLYSNILTWQKAMQLFHVCQPCIAYNLPNVAETYTSSKTSSRRNRRLDNDGEVNDLDGDDPFYCYDAAGYQNVNQVCTNRIIIMFQCI